MEIFVVIKDGTRRYYLLKVQRRGSEEGHYVPNLGVHHSRHSHHKPYVSRFTFEQGVRDTTKEPLVIPFSEAGTPIGNAIEVGPLDDLGSAATVYMALYLGIDTLADNYQEFNKSRGECFVIDRASLPVDTKSILIEVSAVPTRNQVSFESFNRDAPVHLLHKVTSCEPQIWISASPA